MKSTMKGFFYAAISATLLLLAGAARAQTDYALLLNGSNQSVETAITGDKLAGNELTIEYWFKGSRPVSCVRIQDGGVAWIVTGWSQGGPLQHLINTSGRQLLAIAMDSTSGTTIGDGRWHHVAVTYKRNTVGGFAAFLDGSPVPGAANTVDDAIPAINAKVWLGSLNGTQELTAGTLDEIRIWKRALPPDELLDHARNPRRLVGTETGLAAYFPLNETSATATADIVSGSAAILRNTTAASRVPLAGIAFGEPSGRLQTNPAMAGLWKGEVSLKRVNQIFGSSYTTVRSPAGGQFDMNILLHVDAAGTVRVLKDVTFMQQRVASLDGALDTTKIVLVTDDNLLPNYSGVIKRNGKLVGARFSSAFYQFPGLSADLAGGLGLGYATEGTINVPATLPTNPFRHKFHHDHRDPKDLLKNPYDLTRKIHIDFGEQKKLPGDGRDRLKGTYRETITGLNKDTQPVIVEGEISLDRISLVSKLNNQ